MKIAKVRVKNHNAPDIDVIQAEIALNQMITQVNSAMIIGNVFNKFIPAEFREGITFSAKRLLRLAIILYGFRITFQQIFAVGLQGFWADVIMLATTYLLGYYLGTRVFKLDKDLCMLTAIGSSVCGAAAVLGTDSMLKADSHKVSLAVSTVVLFGTISMFLYPFLAGLCIVPESSFGIYIGSTIHEVAQVVAAGQVPVCIFSSSHFASAISFGFSDKLVIKPIT